MKRRLEYLLDDFKEIGKVFIVIVLYLVPGKKAGVKSYDLGREWNTGWWGCQSPGCEDAQHKLRDIEAIVFECHQGKKRQCFWYGRNKNTTSKRRTLYVSLGEVTPWGMV